MSVEAVDTLVHTVISILWTSFALTFTAGAIALRHHWAKETQPEYRGRHRRSLPARLVAALADGWREMAVAHQLLTGGQPWFQA